MAHIWIPNQAQTWAAIELDTAAVVLTPNPPHVATEPLPPAAGPRVWLVQVPGQGDETWVLLSEDSASVAVNGAGVTTGIRVLADRDEIRSPYFGRLFFASERLARIEPFPGSAQTACCPRCRQPLEQGAPSVKCPAARCGIWHHQGPPPLDCWTRRHHCALCAQPTELDRGYGWSPEEASHDAW